MPFPRAPAASSPHASPRYIAIAGPTASGKTAAALALARALPAEIVSVDSALVYRGMDIGTAKPSPEERAEVPHHLIDIRDPREPYSAAAFVADATRLVGEIAARGRLPLLVGGTMMYFRALADGIDPMPATDAALRARLEAEAATLGWPAMHARLADVDPVTAARLSPNDSQRIQRALEVWHASGLPLSHFQNSRRAGTADHEPRNVPATDRPRAAALLSLEPTSRAWLHERIEQRFDAMLEQGFVDEVRALRARGDLAPDLPSMRCVGYRQAWEMLDEAEKAARTGKTDPSSATGRTDLAALRERGIAATRQLAKRQMTWLRSMPERTVVAADAPDAIAQVVAHALSVEAA